VLVTVHPSSSSLPLAVSLSFTGGARQRETGTARTSRSDRASWRRRHLAPFLRSPATRRDLRCRRAAREPTTALIATLLSPATALYGTIYRCRCPTGSEPRCGSGSVGPPPLGPAPGHPSGSRQRSGRRRRGQTQRVERWRAQRETVSTADRRTAIPHDVTGVVGTDITSSEAEGEAVPRSAVARPLPASAHSLPSPLLREDPAVRAVEAAMRRCRAHGGPTRRGCAGDSRAIRGERAVFGSCHEDQAFGRLIEARTQPCGPLEYAEQSPSTLVWSSVGLSGCTGRLG